MAENTQTMYALKELAELLIKHQGIHEGFYELSIEFQMAVGGVGIAPSPEHVMPGAMLGVSRIGITKVPINTPLSVDASQINPQSSAGKSAPSTRRKAKLKA